MSLSVTMEEEGELSPGPGGAQIVMGATSENIRMHDSDLVGTGLCPSPHTPRVQEAQGNRINQLS